MAIATRQLEADPLIARLLQTQEELTRRFVDRWLGALLEHTELTHTLRVFLEIDSPSAAATALFVHISTLKYRLRKIESILGIDLSDPEVCFNLRLAFKILAVHERLSAGSCA